MAYADPNDFEPVGATAVADPSDFEVVAEQANPSDFEVVSSPAAASEPIIESPSGLAPLDSSEFLKSTDPTMGEYAGAGAIGESTSLDNPTIQSGEDMTRALNTPLVTLPKPEGDAWAGVRKVEEVVEGLTSPVNVALLASLGGAPAAIKTAASTYFAATMGKEAAVETKAAVDAYKEGDWTKMGESLVGAGANALLATAAGTHAAGRPASTLAEKAVRIAPETAKPVAETPPVEVPAPPVAELISPEATAALDSAKAIADSLTAEPSSVQPPTPGIPKEQPATAAETTTPEAARPAPTTRAEPVPPEPAESPRPQAEQTSAPSGEVTPATESVQVGSKSVVEPPAAKPELPAPVEGAPAVRKQTPREKARSDMADKKAQTAGFKDAADELEFQRRLTAADEKFGNVIGAKPEAVKPQAEPPASAPPDLETPKLDVRRSPYALGISPDMKAVKWLTDNTKRLFTSKGDLPKETFERWIERNGEVKAESRQVAYASRDLYSALQKEFNISTTEKLTNGFEKVPPEFVKQMNQALLGEVDINTLPESVRAPLTAMRQHIDTLSQRMLDEGVIPESLQAKVADNMGVYMTRSYRVFDDPKWAESIPQDVRNRTSDFILSGLQKENPAATPANARAVMESMLQDWKDQGSGALIKSGGKIGSKDLTSLIARKDIPQVVREFMGEYHDPLINYARSVTKAANLIGSQRFLNQVRSEGMGKFLFEDGKQPASHSALIAAEGSDVMAPLNGLRTTPEIAAAFKEFGKTDPIKNGLLRALSVFSGIAKTAKTVGSVMTQARNILGQTYFFAMNGHFDMTKAAPAVKAVLADLGAKDTPAGRDAYRRYLRLGIVDQSARASELRDTIRDAGLNDPGVSLTEPGKVLAKTARKLTLDAAAKAYQVSDDLGKIIGFENELVRQREIHPDWSETTLEAASAERIRNTYPTYSMVPAGVRAVRQLPFAPFASFAAETFRTAYHNLRYTMEDLQSSIPAQKKAGAQRLAGQLAVVGSGYALSAISRGLLGMNTQDEDDARRFMAPWDKDSQIIFTGKGDGKTTFVNASYVNPYSYLTDPVISVASGLRDADQLDEVMLRSFGKLIQPFTSEDVFASAGFDLMRNKTKTGGRVYNPADNIGDKFHDIAARFYSTLEPGTITRVKTKIIPAIKGETDHSGRKPELSNEILSELTGFKTQTLDYKQAVGFRAREFKKTDDDADSIFRETAARRGSVSEKDLTEAYSRAARSKFQAWQDFYRDAQAARRRGVSEGDIRTAVEARGVSGAEAGAVLSGKFVPPRVSPALAKQMKENKRSLPPAITAEMRRTENLVLSGSFDPR